MRVQLQDHLQRPATINSIEIHGAKNTRQGFLDPLFAPLVSNKRNVGTTLGEVLASIEQVTEKLERFGTQQRPLSCSPPFFA